MCAKIKILLAFILLIQIIGCKEKDQNKNKMTQEEFPYMVTVSAPEEYTVEVNIGYLLDKNKKLICGMPRAGQVNNGWQYDGSKAGMGGSAIPYHLNLTYIAFAEKKVYTVDADLPADKILEAFKKGYDKEERDGSITHETYDVLTVGAAPGGVIVVWLSGSNNRTEICRLQAKETEIQDPIEFSKTMGWSIDGKNMQTKPLFFDYVYQTIPDSIRTEIAKNGIPYGLWDKYRDKYKYRFVLKPYDEKDVFTHNYYLYYNGEADEVLRTELDKKEYMEKGIPYTCNFIFTRYSTEIVFNDQEMLQVFNKLKAKYPDKPIDIVITPTFNYDSMKVSVKCGNEEVKLEKYKVVGVWGG